MLANFHQFEYKYFNLFFFLLLSIFFFLLSLLSLMSANNRESARRSHPLSYECDIIETCCMRLSLLQMTFGRYIEHKHICFFPGAVRIHFTISILKMIYSRHCFISDKMNQLYYYFIYANRRFVVFFSILFIILVSWWSVQCTKLYPNHTKSYKSSI